MRLNASCLLQRLALLTCAALLTGCPAPPRVSPRAPAAAGRRRRGAPRHALYDRGRRVAADHPGVPGGAFAAPATITSSPRTRSAALLRAADAPLQSSFEVHVPVESLHAWTKLNCARRAGPDFPPEVPETAREGTRRNMLGPALLDAQNDPEIVLRAVRLAPAQPPQSAVQARVQARVRGAPHEFDVPVRYERSGERLVVSGEHGAATKRTRPHALQRPAGSPAGAGRDARQLPHRRASGHTDQRRERGRPGAPGRPLTVVIWCRARPAARRPCTPCAAPSKMIVRIDRHRAVQLRVEPVVAGDGVDVAVEHQADDLALRIDQRAAGVAADDVVVGGEVEARLQVQLRLRLAASCRAPGTVPGRWPRSKGAPRCVNGSTRVPFSFQPCTVPKFRRSVKVASGETLVP